MNKNLVKAALHSANTNTRELLDKFLDADKFNLMDIYWWWDPNQGWYINKVYATRALKVLKKEGCITRVLGYGCCYQKTSAFVDLLNEMVRLEELLKRIDEWQ